jgi:hypothetical protein
MNHPSFRISAERPLREVERFGDVGTDETHQPIYELDLNVWEFEIVKDVPRGFPTVFGDRMPDNEPTPWPADGVFVPRGYIEQKRLVPPARSYKPVPDADEILTHVTRLDTRDNESLLDFANKWGLLGLEGDPDVYARLGIFPPESRGRYRGELDRMFYRYAIGGFLPLENVRWFRRELKRVQQMANALYILQGKGSRGPRTARRRDVELSWTDFADELNTMIGGIYRAVREKKGGGLRLVECPNRLLDVLGLALLERAIGVTRQRRCPECGSYFRPTRSNQRFCKRGGEQYCARKRALHAWRQRNRRRTKKR